MAVSLGPYVAVLSADPSGLQKGMDTAAAVTRRAMAEIAEKTGASMAQVQKALASPRVNAASYRGLARQDRAIADVQSEIEQLGLRSAGRVEEAQLAGINHRFNRQINKAREAGQVELAIALDNHRRIALDSERVQQQRRRLDEQASRSLLRRDLFTGEAAARPFSLEGLAKGGLIASATINSLNIASKAFSGNIRDAADAVKTLPFGIGQMARALEDVLGTWTGIGTEAANYERLAKSINASTDAWVKGTNDARAAQRALQERASATRDASELVGLAGPDLTYRRSAQQRARSTEAIRKSADEAIRARREALRKQLREIEAGRAQPSEAFIGTTAVERWWGAGGVNAPKGLADYDREVRAERELSEDRRINYAKEVAQRSADKDIASIRKSAGQAAVEEKRLEFRTDAQAFKEHWQQRITDLGKYLGDMAKQQRDQRTRAERETKADQQKQIADARAEDKRFKGVDEHRSVAVEIAATRARLRGDAGRSELLTVAHDFAQRINEARRRGDTTGAQQLTELANVRLEEIQRRGGGGSQVANLAYAARGRGGGAATQVQGIVEILKLLGGIYKEMERGPVARAG